MNETNISLTFLEELPSSYFKTSKKYSAGKYVVSVRDDGVDKIISAKTDDPSDPVIESTPDGQIFASIQSGFLDVSHMEKAVQTAQEALEVMRLLKKEWDNI